MREQWIENSQPPPSARPYTAAMVGTCAYLRRCETCWNFATTASTCSTWPVAALSTSPSPPPPATVYFTRCAAPLSLSNNPAGGASLLSCTPCISCSRCAPAENGASVCQRITAPKCPKSEKHTSQLH